jgi:uncharacterized oligopeptide transporter (OPT) family protein
MIVGSVLGVLFVSLVRRAMVEDRTLPFPESVAAAEIHKAGQRGRRRREVPLLQHVRRRGRAARDDVQPVRVLEDFFMHIGELGGAPCARRGEGANAVAAGGVTKFSVPDVSAAYIGVGYIIGPGVAAMNFAGAVLAWGFMVPLLIYFLGPQLHQFLPPDVPVEGWDNTP